MKLAAKLLHIVVIALTWETASAQVTRDLTLKVTDDLGALLNGAEARVRFQVIGGDDVREGQTDLYGEFAASIGMTFSTSIRVGKSGYYTAFWGSALADYVPVGKATIPVVLPRVLQPIPLHALRLDYLHMPAQNEWLGYDLATADWVAPHGKGKVVDIRFKYRKEFMGYRSDGENLARAREISRISAERRGEILSEEAFKESAGHWSGVLEVSFPNEKEGVIIEGEHYWFYGQLRLPHSAPEKGYRPSLRYEMNTIGPRQSEKLIGYYLRTRVKLDADGDIISANYAKIYGDLRFDARGTVSFWYYFNPTPNDRNLEFDPARNLFPRSMKGANVASP